MKLVQRECPNCGKNAISQGADPGPDVNVVLDSEAEEGAWWR